MLYIYIIGITFIYFCNGIKGNISSPKLQSNEMFLKIYREEELSVWKYVEGEG